MKMLLYSGNFGFVVPRHHRSKSASVVAHTAAVPADTWHQGSGSRSSCSSIDSRYLNSQINRANSTVELLQLHAAHHGRLDAIHYAVFFSKLLQATQHASSPCKSHANRSLAPKSSRQRQRSPQHNQQQQQQHKLAQQQQLYEQQLHPEQQRHQLLQSLLSDLPSVAHTMHPGPLSLVLRALAKLKAQPQPRVLHALLFQAHQRLGFAAFDTRQLCTLAHALSDLQPVCLPWTLQQQQQQQQRRRASLSWQHEDVSPTGASTTSMDKSSSCGWDDALLHDLFHALGTQMHTCNAQDIAQAVLAVARLHYAPPEAWLRIWLLRAHKLLPHFTPQGLANGAYGLVRALQLTGVISGSGANSNSSQSNDKLGLVSLQQQQQQELQQSSQRREAQESAQQRSGLLTAAQSWLQSCLRVAVLHLNSLQPQELVGQLLWAAGKLSSCPEGAARHHLLSSAQAMMPSCDARHQSAALYACALLDHRPEDTACGALWASLAHQVQDLAHRDLAQLLWAASRLQTQPPPHLRVRLQRHASLLLGQSSENLGRTLVHGAAAGDGEQQQQQLREMVGVLKGMVGLRWQLQDKYVVRFQGAFLEQLHCCVPQDVADTLWALAVAGVRPEDRWFSSVSMAASACLHRFSPQHLSQTVWALAKLQHQPAKPLLQQILLASWQQMSSFAPVDFSQLLWGLSNLGHTPSPLWLSTFWSHSLDASSSNKSRKYTPAELHALLLAVVQLDLQPPQGWVQAAAAAVEEGLAGFGSQQLLEVLRSLQQLWQRSAVAPAAAAAAPAYISHTGSTNSSRRPAFDCHSSVVPFNSRVWHLNLQTRLQGADAAQQGDASCHHTRGVRTADNSSSSRSLHVRCSPSMIRLHRQLCTLSCDIRPFVGSTHGAGSVQCWSCSEQGGQTLLGGGGTANTSRTLSLAANHPWPSDEERMQLLQQKQPQEPRSSVHNGPQSIPGWSGAAEAYSLACLVLLMPPGVRSRVEQWPKLLAGQLSAQAQNGFPAEELESREQMQVL